jgi:signal transduction histidine kinase
VTTTSNSVTLDALLLAWPEAMLIVDSSGTIVSANDAACTLLRIGPHNGHGLRLSDFVGDNAAATLLPTAGDVAVHRSGDDTAAAGRTALRGRSARMPNGEFLVRLDDATEEWRLRSHLEHAERLASIGELLSSVAHELSNPLTTVLGYADLLLTDEDANAPREELERIRAEALRCRRIVANLLDLSRAEAMEFRPVAIGTVIDKVIELRSYATQIAQIEIVRVVPDDLPVIAGDQHRLVQTLLNLVHNAEDAVRERSSGRRIVLRARRTAKGLAVDVEDVGRGVPAAIRPFIFDPFFTTKPRGRGTGLGLSLVRATAEAHGGSVRVDDAPAGGALFTIELPASH